MKNKCFQSKRLTYRPYCKDGLHMVHAYFNEASRRRWFYFQEPDCLTIEFAEREINKSMETWSRKVAEKAGMTFTHAEKHVSVYEIRG